MSEVPSLNSNPLKPWLIPYSEYRLLAGFLSAESVPKVHPPSEFWPEDVAARIHTVQAAAPHVKPRPEAGQCRLFPIEEPDALDVLQNVSTLLPIGTGAPVSYSWIEINSLIATMAIADPMPVEADFTGAQALAQYSLLGSEASFYLASGGPVFVNAPVNVKLVGRRIQRDQLILNYQLSLTPRLIVVGYHDRRFHLLTAYGRVLRAIKQKVDRLLCLIHYGLDLDAPNLGVRLLENSVNHFGRGVLEGDNPPLVRDFLDPTLSVVFPSRSSFFMISPLVHVQPVQTTPPSQLASLPTADKDSDTSDRVGPGE